MECSLATSTADLRFGRKTTPASRVQRKFSIPEACAASLSFTLARISETKRARVLSCLVFWLRILDVNSFGSTAEGDRHFNFPLKTLGNGFGLELDNVHARLQ